MNRKSLRLKVQELCRQYQAREISQEDFEREYSRIIKRIYPYRLLPRSDRNDFELYRWMGPDGPNHGITELDLLRSQIEDACDRYEAGKIGRLAFERLYFGLLHPASDPLYAHLPENLRERFEHLGQFRPGAAALEEDLRSVVQTVCQSS